MPFVEPVDISYISDIWGAAPDDVYAGANYFDGTSYTGMILHYDGSAWSVVRSGEEPFVGSIWGLAADDIYFQARYFGTSALLHYDGSDWTVSELPTGLHTTNYLMTFAGVSGLLYAAGAYTGGLFRFDGATWTEMSYSAIDSAANAVWGFAENDIFVVAENGKDRKSVV